MKRMAVSAIVLGAVLVGANQRAEAVLFGGIDFPQGASSFADSLLDYDPLFSGGPVPDAVWQTPGSALGPPDYDGGTQLGSVSLGRGGLIELAFTDNLLTNSGSADNDLHIFEVGPDVEDTFVAIRPTAATLALLDPADDANGDGFFEIGKVFGATSSLDIDAIFPGFGAGVLRFDAVQLIDDPAEGDQGGSSVGADIDAVGAISSIAQEPGPDGAVPEPLTASMGALSAAALAFASRRRR